MRHHSSLDWTDLPVLSTHGFETSFDVYAPGRRSKKARGAAMTRCPTRAWSRRAGARGSCRAFGARLFLRGKKSPMSSVRSVALTHISGREVPMRTQRARRFSRRRFLGGVTLAGTAGLLGLRPRSVAAEPPPETTRIRLVQIP